MLWWLTKFTSSFPFLYSPFLILSIIAVRISKGLKQAYELQDFVFEAALALKASLRRHRRKLVISREDASAIGSLVKAWESCQERIRIHRGKPLPGVLRPEPKPRKKRLPTATGADPVPALTPPSP
jgi:hypothetical protein